MKLNWEELLVPLRVERADREILTNQWAGQSPTAWSYHFQLRIFCDSVTYLLKYFQSCGCTEGPALFENCKASVSYLNSKHQIQSAEVFWNIFAYLYLLSYYPFTPVCKESLDANGIKFSARTRNSAPPLPPYISFSEILITHKPHSVSGQRRYIQ